MIRERLVRAEAASREEIGGQAEIDRVANAAVPSGRLHPKWSRFAGALRSEVWREWAWLVLALATVILLLGMLMTIVSSPDFVFGVP